MNFVEFGNNLARLFQDEQSTQTVLATKPAQNILHQALGVWKALPERNKGQVVHFLTESGKIDIDDLEKLENILEAGGFVKVGTINNSPNEKPPQDNKTLWRERVEREDNPFHPAQPSDKTVSMEVKVLPPVRKASKELAAAHGMTAQQFVEYLLVDALNNSPEELEQGKKRLKEFKGSTAKARRFAEREELARLRQLTGSPNR